MNCVPHPDDPSAAHSTPTGSGDRRPLWLRLTLAFVPLVIGIPLIWSTAYFVRLLGIILTLIGSYSLAPLVATGLGLHANPNNPSTAGWRIGRWRFGWMPGALPVVVVFAVAGGILWPWLIGEMPLSQDHTVHVTRAWHFLTRNLAHGQLSGWSDLWYAGWPAGEDYPPGGDYWIGGFYLATLGLLGWEWTYGVAFMVMYAAAACGVYAFGRVYFGRLTGLLGALFFLLDAGAYREGGWNYTVHWGVWPQVLSTGFTFFTFATINAAITRRRPRDVVVCAACFAYSLICHPVAVMYYGLGLPVYLLARLLGRNEKPGQVIARSLMPLALGGMLAAYWLIPFIAKADWMARYGELWKSLPAMGDGIWNGALFQNATPPLVWLGVLGAFLAAWRRDYAAIFLAGFGGLTLFVASSTAFQQFDLLSVSSSFGQVQFQRLAIVAKVCVWLLAAYSARTLFQIAPNRSSTFTWKRYALACLLILTVAPFVQPMITGWAKRYGGGIGRPKVSRDFPYWKEYRRFLDWSRDLQTKETGFFRMAYVRPYNDHFFSAAPIFNKIPFYKVGYTPCSNFVHKPDVADPQLYELLSVKYVVTLNSSPGPHTALVKSFGPIQVYRFERYTNKRYTVQGGGDVTVEAFDPEGDGIRLRATRTGPNSRLVLHLANYPNWRAQVEQKDIPITTAQLGAHNIFASLPIRDGTIEIHYAWPMINVASAAVSWIGLAVLLLLLWTRISPEKTARMKTLVTCYIATPRTTRSCSRHRCRDRARRARRDKILTTAQPTQSATRAHHLSQRYQRPKPRSIAAERRRRANGKTTRGFSVPNNAGTTSA